MYDAIATKRHIRQNSGGKPWAHGGDCYDEMRSGHTDHALTVECLRRHASADVAERE